MSKNNPYLTDRQRIQQVLNTAYIMRVAIHDGEAPYIVPLNFGYLDEKLYFHSSKTGKKIDLFHANSKVGFEIDTNVAIQLSDVPCKNSFQFQSVIGTGIISMVEDAVEKRKGLLSLSRQIGNTSEELNPKSVDQVAVFRLDILTCTYKQSPVN